MKLFIILTIFLSFNIFALVPSPESLLRNNNNGYIGEKFSMIAFSVKAVDLNGRVEDESFYKLTFENSDSHKVNMLQIQYANGQMDDGKIIEVKHFSNLERAVNNDKNISRKLFYSLIHSLTTNDSYLIGRSLKTLDSSFPLNVEILNQEKLKLLEAQKRFLASSKRDSSFRDKNFSPLNPESDSEKSKVQELLKQSTYRDTGLVSLEKLQDKYYLSLKSNNIFGLFSAIDYRLNKLEAKFGEELYSFETTNYILFDGTREYPKVIKITGNNSRIYNLQVLNSQHYNNSKLDFSAKAQYLAKLSKSSKPASVIDELLY